MRVQAQGVIGDVKALGPRHIVLALLDLGVVELLDPTAVQAHQMVVVLALIELVDRLVALEMAANQDTGLLELRQHPVDRGQANV